MQIPGDNNVDHEIDSTNWCVFYPIYFDNTRTSCQGRRVSKEKGVPQPTANDILQAAQHLGLNCYMESMKRHPKEPFVFGRVRIQLPDDCISKKKLLMNLCNVLPQIVQENKLKKSNATDSQKKKPANIQSSGSQLMVRKKKK